jgi:hypothetical protein
LAKGPSESDFINMKLRIDGTEKSDSLMRKTLTEHEKKLKQLKHGHASALSDVPPGPVDELADLFKEFKFDFDEHLLYVNKEL